MSDNHAPPPVPGALREEAAYWFAHMRGPDAEQDRAAFEAWLAKGPLHLAAYNRAAEIYAMGKILSDENVPTRETPVKASPRETLVRAIVLVATCLGAIVLASYYFAATPGQRASQDLLAQAATNGREIRSDLGAQKGQVRMFRLADGSAVTLDSDSRATIEFDGAGRRISLTRGRARFDVAHEGRPFLVKAGHGVVTAHGTVFDVQLTEQGQVKVHLLQGRVEVKSHASAGGGSSDRTRAIMLRPNEAAIYADAIPVRRQDRPAGTEAWAAVVQSLHDVPLSSVIELANRNSPTQIILADRSIGEIRVSGRMVINDPTTVADKLARLFQLEAVKQPDQSILLRRPVSPNTKIIPPATP